MLIILQASSDTDAKLKELREICLKETQVDPQLIADAKMGKFADDAKLKTFFICVTKKLGLVSDGGEIHEDILNANAVQVLGDKALADKLQKECSAKKSTIEDTIFEKLKCYYAKSGPALLASFWEMSEHC